ncbi:MAG TPA: hypothetical protein VN192_02800 [Flavobacterium sp.]|nr:hypothetical protein [Flavobacterium sp.]
MKIDMRLKIEECTIKIGSYLIFTLKKEVTIFISDSGSGYIRFDYKTIKLSDHDFHTRKHDIFIDVRMFTDAKYCLKYFIENYIEKTKA